MKVYKVVENFKGRLVSALIFGKAVVEYTPGEWTEAPKWLARKGYHITAFKDLVDARDFAAFNSTYVKHMEIWQAEAEGVSEDLPAMMNPFGLSCGVLEKCPDDFLWLSSTIMCRRLKLVRKLDWKEIEKMLKED